MNFKRVIKMGVSILRYPRFGFRALSTGCSSFFIGKRAQINSYRNITVNDNFSVGSDLRITIIDEYHGDCYKPSLVIGKNVNISNRFTALVADEVIIGDDVLIASDVLVTSENHGMDPLSNKSYACQPLNASPVIIGDGCWIGEKATIMPGVKIGKKCIVAANAVVTYSCPDYCIIGGVPARIIKRYDFTNNSWVKENQSMNG